MTRTAHGYYALNLMVKAGFIGRAQYEAIQAGFQDEGYEYYFEKIAAMADKIAAMPSTYQQDALGDDAVVHLHYFIGRCDWYITEKDKLSVQDQAFGMAVLGYGGELGYISLAEITSCHAELDLHWTPVTLAQLKKTP